MKLLEIKNNLVKISYTTDEPIALAKFIALVDNNRSYVGQIINLKAEAAFNYAIAKLIFTFNTDGIVDNYDGTIPSLQAELSYLNSKDIISLFPIENPIALGELAQQNEMLRVDRTIFEKNLVICAEKFDNTNTIVNNSTAQLTESGEKVVVIDTDHIWGEFEPVRFKRDFKLPLNAEMIDYIYENDLEEVDATSKAVIQDIFAEVREYTNTVENGFIPFDTFLNVVSQQYQQTNIPELALLKNKLLKYQEENVFAQSNDDIISLKSAIQEHSVTYVDIADVSDNLQKQLIGYIHNIMNTLDDYIYLFVKLTNKNSDKKLLKQIVDNDHIFTTIICSHSYKYLAELKQRAENLIFFAPQTVQHDFASYNTLLNKLNTNEFVVCGALTQNVPLIVELAEFSDDEQTYEEDYIEETKEVEPPAEELNEELPTYDFEELEEIETPEIISEEDAFEEINIPSDEIETQPIDHEELVEQVSKDVDEIFYNKPEEIPSIEEIVEPSEEILTEDDLDFIDELPQEEQFVEQPEEFEQIEEEVITEEPVLEDIPTEYEIEPEEETHTEESIEEEVFDDTPQEELPVYPADEPVLDTPAFEQGDTVTHPKYGKGVIEKLIKYGNKTLCSISFENVGRRLLDPAISDLQKV